MSFLRTFKVFSGVAVLSYPIINRSNTLYLLDDEDKKPIYSKKPQTEEGDKDPPTRLELYVKKCREYVSGKVGEAKSESQKLVSKLHEYENEAINSVNSVRGQNESFLPGAVYVSVAAMAGSIIFRKSNILVRFCSPLVFGTTATYFAFPDTFKNVYSKLSESYPVLADVSKYIDTTRSSSRELYNDLNSSLEQKVHDARVQAIKLLTSDPTPKNDQKSEQSEDNQSQPSTSNTDSKPN
ncbi:hypothetical protein BB560_006721 [Smittium megazygosporum]|uniref:MICOS complex subunit n=1 Tax=Smittium megazygosporum TaxID=133381 RepID=A0A2T9Y262_9FUNG|nr:hypothetical protein BB560_006721 [Smittium megazygosporum]